MHGARGSLQKGWPGTTARQLQVTFPTNCDITVAHNLERKAKNRLAGKPDKHLGECPGDLRTYKPNMCKNLVEELFQDIKTIHNKQLYIHIKAIINNIINKHV